MKTNRSLAAKFRSLLHLSAGAKKARMRRSTRRGLLFEQMEERRVMAFDGFAPPAMLYTGGSIPSDVAVADLNRDGRQDLVVAEKSVGLIHVYLGNGQGGFNLQAALSPGSGPIAEGLQVADMNGDGRLDILAIRGGDVRLFLQDSAGSFSSPINTGVRHDVNKPLAVGDLNGDGRLDIVAGREGGRDGDWFVEAWLNNGNGTFARSQTMDTGSYTNQILDHASLGIGDINGDGRADVVLAGRDNALRLFQGNGNGTFQLQILGPGSAPGFRGLKLRDLNGDSRADVMVANEANDTVGVRLNQGNGVFGVTTNYAVGDQPVQLEVGDIDADGLLDLITANQGPFEGTSTTGDRVSFLKGSGNGTFQNAVDYLAGLSPNTDVTIQPSDIALGDLNGDGLLDAIVGHSQGRDSSGNSVSGRVSILLATGTASPPDYAGNSMGAARELGVLTGTRVFQDFVGNRDLADYYRFSVTQRSEFSLALNGLRADIDVQLLGADGQVIISSVNGGSNAEAISRTLESGTYFIHVYPYGGAESNYDLTLTANPLARPANYQFSQPSYTFNEGVGTGSITIIRGGDLSQTSIAWVSTAYVPSLSNPALPPGDFIERETRLTFAPGETSKNFTFSINDDQIVEGTEVMRILLGTISPSDTVVGSASAEVSITDNDQANLRVLDTYLSDQNGNRIDGPRAGMPWYVTVDFETNSIPANSSYTIRQSLDGGNTMQNTVTWGSGTSGIGRYRHIWGAWTGIAAGNHSFTVSLDAGNRISETNEWDNSRTVAFVASTGDLAGNSLATARNVGYLSGARVFQDHVFSNDSSDYYRFSLSSRSNFSVTLTELTANADIELLDQSGRILAYSRQSGTATEALARTLEAGTYFVRVVRGSSTANTVYNLTLSAASTFVRTNQPFMF